MMVVLAARPGAFTGWAMVSEHGAVIACGALSADELDLGLDHMIRLAHRRGATIQAVVESGAKDFDSRLARRLVDDTLGVYDVPTIDVRPADWSRSSAARDFAYPPTWDGSPLGDIARLAIGLAAYYLKPGPQLRKLKNGHWTPWRSTDPVERVARARLPR